MTSPDIPLGQYLIARLIETRPKTEVYGVFSAHHGDKLGVIKWFRPWRQYCFFVIDVTVLSSGCLKDLTSFLEELNRKHKQGK
jgi:hypothetical protein